MPQVVDYSAYNEIKEKFEVFLKFRSDVLKALETARSEKVIGKSLNAHLIVKPTQEIKDVLDFLGEDYAQLLIVSKFELLETQEELEIKVIEKSGHVCSRCWQVVDDINENELCPRCQKVVDSL